jgi:hypothetical protein
MSSAHACWVLASQEHSHQRALRLGVNLCQVAKIDGHSTQLPKEQPQTAGADSPTASGYRTMSSAHACWVLASQEHQTSEPSGWVSICARWQKLTGTAHRCLAPPPDEPQTAGADSPTADSPTVLYHTET